MAENDNSSNTPYNGPDFSKGDLVRDYLTKLAQFISGQPVAAGAANPLLVAYELMRQQSSEPPEFVAPELPEPTLRSQDTMLQPYTPPAPTQPADDAPLQKSFGPEIFAQQEIASSILQSPDLAAAIRELADTLRSFQRDSSGAPKSSDAGAVPQEPSQQPDSSPKYKLMDSSDVEAEQVPSEDSAPNIESPQIPTVAPLVRKVMPFPEDGTEKEKDDWYDRLQYGIDSNVPASTEEFKKYLFSRDAANERTEAKVRGFQESQETSGDMGQPSRSQPDVFGGVDYKTFSDMPSLMKQTVDGTDQMSDVISSANMFRDSMATLSHRLVNILEGLTNDLRTDDSRLAEIERYFLQLRSSL